MNVLTTLKTILISKKIMNPVYMVVFIDAMIFASILTKVTSSEGLQYTLAYALGKSFGVFLGGKLHDKMALGIIEVDIFISNNEKRILASEALRTACKSNCFRTSSMERNWTCDESCLSSGKDGGSNLGYRL